MSASGSDEEDQAKLRSNSTDTDDKVPPVLFRKEPASTIKTM